MPFAYEISWFSSMLFWFRLQIAPAWVLAGKAVVKSRSVGAVETKCAATLAMPAGGDDLFRRPSA
jgi:hypothetical protein